MSRVNDAHLYDQTFYDQNSASVTASVRAILPVVLDAIPVRSAVDVGCGVGLWLSVARDLGVAEVRGIDGAHVDPASLCIPRDEFTVHDLTTPLRLDRRFDLAICLEVAEHLEGVHAARLVDDLTALAPAVLFSAAIPGQGGLHHVNEQWPPYWVELFAARRYQVIDCIRPRFWNQPDVEVWYSQNTFLFVDSTLLESTAALQALAAERWALPLAVVHPVMFGARTDPGFVRRSAILGSLPDPVRAGLVRARAAYRRRGRRTS